MIKWKKNGTFVVFIGFPHVELNASLTQVLMYLEQISTCAKSRFWQETLKNAQKTGSRKLAREMPLTFIKSKISVFSARYMSKFCRLELLENCTRQTPSKSVMDIQKFFRNSYFCWYSGGFSALPSVLLSHTLEFPSSLLLFACRLVCWLFWWPFCSFPFKQPQHKRSIPAAK